MKTFILFFAILGFSHCGLTQVKSDQRTVIQPLDKDSFSLIDQFEEYHDIEQEGRISFDSRFQNTLFFDTEKSIENLINTFGSDFWKIDESILRGKINEYLERKSQPKRIGFYYWQSSLDSIATELRERKKIPISSYIHEHVWDGFTDFDHLLNDGSHIMFTDSTDSYLWNYSTYYNPLLQKIVLPDMEDILLQLNSISNPEQRANNYILFMRNLYSDKNWPALFQVAQKFIDLVIDDYISKPKEDFTTYNEFSIVSFNRNNVYRKFPLLSQQTKQVNHSDYEVQHLEITWIVSTIKLLMTCPIDEINTRDHILHNFGKLIAILESDESLENELRLVRKLEIAYFEKLSLHSFFDSEYLEWSTKLRKNEAPHNYGKSDLDYVRFNLGYALTSLQYWQLNKLNESSYFDLGRLQIAQFLYNAHEHLALDTSDLRTHVKICFTLFTLQSDYFLLSNKYEASSITSFCALELIEKYPEYFTIDDFNSVVFSLGISYRRVNNLNESNSWFSFLNPEYELEPMLADHFDGDINNWTFQDIKTFADPMLKEFEAGSLEIDELDKLISPLVRLILFKAEVGYLERKNYKQAYIASVLRNEVFIDPENTLQRLLDIEEYKRREITKKINDQSEFELRQKTERYEENIGDLIGDFNTRTYKLNEVSDQFEQRKKELVLLNNSISKQKEVLVSLNDTIEDYQDSIFSQDSIIRFKESLNRKLEIAEENANQQKDIAQSKAQELEIANSQLYALIIGIGVVTILALVFLIILYFQRIKLRKEKRKAILQKDISDCLRSMVSQVSHFGTNLISSFQKRHFETEENFKQLTYRIGNEELVNTERILKKCTRNSTDSIITQSLENEVEIGLNMAFIENSEHYTLDELKELCEIDENLLALKVPLYSLSNIIHNTFKHSVEGSVQNIRISSQQQSSEFITLKITETAKKHEDLDLHKIGNGTRFILRVLDIFNEDIKPEFLRSKNKQGIITEFNLKLTA